MKLEKAHSTACCCSVVDNVDVHMLGVLLFFKCFYHNNIFYVHASKAVILLCFFSILRHDTIHKATFCDSREVLLCNLIQKRRIYVLRILYYGHMLY